ncbi:MAG: hypothetical protein DWQ04_07525 [Chloroflexi bacterium]|nr:MAG: hypothetical protein DWQ04_07525 [Chloroflexota bacterium]
MFKTPKNRKVHRVLLLSILLLVSLLLAASLKAESNNVDSYIVVMKLDPVIAYDGAIRGYAATQPAEGDKINPNSANVRRYQAFLQKGHEDSLAAAGAGVHQQVNDYTYSLNGYSALLTKDQVKEIESQAGVLMVMEDELHQPTTDNSPSFLGLDVRNGAWDTGFTGEGVVVGIIDSGIWPEHSSFADDGSFAAPPIVLEDTPANPACNFGNTTHHPADVAFTCNNKLVGARQMLSTYRTFIGADADEFDSARDDDGHGTHTASTAAGNADVAASIFGIPRGQVSGIAPRAHVVAYKGLGKLGGFTSDLAASIDQAVADGVDVINYSIGGGASSPGADEISFLFAADAGVFVATSAGNSGPGAATLGNPGTVPWMTTVGASIHDRAFQGSASSSDGWEFFGASITPSSAELPLVDAEDAGDELCNPGALSSAVVAGKIVLCKRGAIARAAKSQAVFLAGGAGMILYNANDSQSQVTDNHWVPSVHINNTDGLVIKAYIDSAASAVAKINGGEKTEVDAPWMAAFSSRGPNPVAGDIIKPDITAPGVQILAGASPIHYGDAVQGELFQAIAGTSMSSPHVAGIFALLKQAQPDWTPAMAKSAIMTSAYQDVMKEDGATPADPFDMGAGHLKPVVVREFTNPWFPDHVWRVGTLRNSAFDPGLVYDAGFLDYLGFLCDAFPDNLSDPEGTCAFLESNGIPTDASDLNLASIGVGELAGTQIVQRTVTAEFGNNFNQYPYSLGNRRVVFRPRVKAPPGYEVTVSPRRLILRDGETATYSVTITNVDAPVGEWRFGSLTWRGAGYEVYSPIAVNAALFDAPTAVSGSATSGSASFDVNFGYTGSYAAAPHGLIPATLSSDTISQDPDQTYPSGDDGAGVDTWAFPISGAAFVRWSLVIPGDDDIDLFLEDSTGTIIASSTSGGTDELIELVLPADDTYTMVVHGWSVPNQPLAYTLSSWVVPLTPGGSLSVDSAPASASLATTGTIDISWSGLAGGTQYLGAVSHTGDVGLMGLTLVEVDTP